MVNFKINKAFLTAATIIVSVVVALPLIKAQVQRAVGQKLLRFFTLDPSFWVEQMREVLPNILMVLSLTTKDGYGIEGALILPFTLLAFTGLILSVFRFRRIFREGAVHAGLILFLFVIFIIMLSTNELINIRFRSPVMPLLIVLVVPTYYYYFDRLKNLLKHLNAVRKCTVTGNGYNSNST